MLILIRRLITRNWILKLLSLSLASLMWFAVWSDSNDQMPLTVPLIIRNFPEDMEITGQPEDQVRLQLRGSFDLLSELSSADITASISLAGEEPGPKNFTINIDTPRGVEVFGVNPDRVEFDLEQTVQKIVQIQEVIQGDPAEGYQLDDVFVAPGEILIEGPASSVDMLEILSTTPIRIDGRNESFQESVNVDVPETGIRLESLAPVDVFVRIFEISAAVTVELPPDPELAGAWTIGVETLAVSLSGPASEIESFTSEGVYFGFDAASVGVDGSVIPNIVGLPESFEVLEFSPQTVVVSAIP